MSGPRTVTLCGRALDEPGRICVFFDSRAEEYDIFAPYYKEGIVRDEELIAVVDARLYDSMSIGEASLYLPVNAVRPYR